MMMIAKDLQCVFPRYHVLVFSQYRRGVYVYVSAVMNEHLRDTASREKTGRDRFDKFAKR